MYPTFTVISPVRLEHRQNEEERKEGKKCNFIYGTIFLVLHEVYVNFNDILSSVSEQKDFSRDFVVK